MLFMVRFTDRPDRAEVRAKFLDAHMAWLEAHREAIRLGGPLRVEPESVPAGAMWLVEADSREAAAALFADDPFWVNGLRAGVEILQWRKAVPNGPATL